MRNVNGATASEIALIKGIQHALSVKEDGSIGASTITAIAGRLRAQCFPITISIYNAPCIVANDIVPLSVRNPLSAFPNSLSGSFNDGSAPCSILAYNGTVIREVSCHYWDDASPESVMYRTENGAVSVKRVKSLGEISGKLRWAVGGMGLMSNYAPSKEGFKGRFSDVLRTTNHTMLGYKDGLMYLVYCRNMSAVQVNNLAIKMGLTYAILLDGGHLAAINGAESFAKINTAQRQLYIIKGI